MSFWGKSVSNNSHLACLCLRTARFATCVPAQPAASLTLGWPLTSTQIAGDYHCYPLSLTAGECARIVIKQHQRNFKLTLLTAGGVELMHVDDPRDGLEVFHVVAEDAAAFRLQISAVEAGATAGHYVINWAETHDVTPRDRETLAISGRRLHYRVNADGRQSIVKSAALAYLIPAFPTLFFLCPCTRLSGYKFIQITISITSTRECEVL